MKNGPLTEGSVRRNTKHMSDNKPFTLIEKLGMVVIVLAQLVLMYRCVY